MTEQQDRNDVLETERRVLQALCQGTVEGSVRGTAKLLLRTYRWREPAHQVIFEAVMSIPSEDSAVVRDQLPARVTRKGFPDLEWGSLFRPHRLSKEEAEELMEQLAHKF